jgi:hypothetical protein
MTMDITGFTDCFSVPTPVCWQALGLLHSGMWVVICLLMASATLGLGDDRLVGVWTVDEGFQTVEFIFRSDGRYQLDTRSNDPVLDFSSSERGRYSLNGQSLTLTPYDYFGEPQHKPYEFEAMGDSLTLNRLDFPQTQVCQLKPGSRADVLARENVDKNVVGTWERSIQFFGNEAYTFRPGGYYFRKDTHEDSQFPPDFVRGRYEQVETRLALNPYSGTQTQYEIDFFGNTLTIIEKDAFSARSASYEAVPGSAAEVRAKSAAAEAFLSRTNWQVGVWELRDGIHTVDLTLRPDGYYSATNHTESLRGMVRGRYTLEPRRLQLFPFAGQGLYSRDNGDFGKVEHQRELDYYDGELQLINLTAISQTVTIARKRPGSDTPVMEKVQQAQLERARADWHIGIWEVNDPAGWMEFTLRPDQRYIAQAGAEGVPSQVERGRYLLRGGKITLAPYAGLGVPRGFELDLFDGDLFLIGDPIRMVIARKLPGSEIGVIEKTRNPDAMKGERGSILGLWTANLPGLFSELVFRQDGEFRLHRCQNNIPSQDYGLYTVDMTTRTVVYDSRFTPVQTLGIDFYGNTMTLFGGPGAPSTYTVNLGVVDAAIGDSLADDAAEAHIDAQWITRVPVGPRDPNAVQIPTGDIPADPNPGRIFNAPTVLANYQLYRRLVPGFVYFDVQGTIRSVAVVHTREWHFFPTGRVLVRFRNYRAGLLYPVTVVDVSESWGAYRVEAKPALRDILHLYADNALWIETDLGELAEMTLEDGRRHLFWAKDYQILSEWAAEQQPIPCQSPGNPNASLANTGVSLSTQIQPDDIADARPIQIRFEGSASLGFTITGTTEVAGPVVIERAYSLASPIAWQPVRTNHASSGPFRFPIPQDVNPAAYFRLRGL